MRRWRKETWTLSQTGNWLAHNVGTNSAANNALVETGTFNTANEWTGRSRTVPGTASDTLVYDKVGNLVNDGKGLAYKYDGLGRLREVRLTGESNRLKTAYRYNGLGMRITHAINMSEGNSDDDVTDAGDPVTYFAYDERWRVAGAWVSSANTTPSSSTPTERWIHHAAGFGGTGGSSYIDSVVLRDRDVVTSGGSASSTSDGGSDALEERIYVLQNWRADVVATVGRTGTLIEWMQYTAYGSAITNPPGNADFNGDGDVDASDTSAFFDAFTAGLLSADVNNDGSVTGDDVEAFDEIWDAGLNPEPGVCVFTAIRIGFAGYQWDGSVNVASARGYTGAMAGLYHVRHRVYDPEMGRWTRRDPIGYVDGMGLYEYVRSVPHVLFDTYGLRAAMGSRCLACCGEPPCCNTCGGGSTEKKYCNPRDMFIFDGCKACAAAAEKYATEKGLVPGGECFDWFIQHFMLACGSIPAIQSGIENANKALELCNGTQTVNGCTKVPEYHFTECCNKHDRCYSTCGKKRNACDNEFCSCLKSECRTLPTSQQREDCRTIADVYCVGVKMVGFWAYSEAQLNACRRLPEQGNVIVGN